MINKVLKSYSDKSLKLSALDKRLLNGLYKKQSAALLGGNSSLLENQASLQDLAHQSIESPIKIGHDYFDDSTHRVPSFKDHLSVRDQFQTMENNPSRFGRKFLEPISGLGETILTGPRHG